MYGWLWRHLPGDTLTRVYTAVVAAMVAAALLWFVVFPWIEPKIHFDHGTVGDGGAPTAPARPGMQIKSP